jgi:hypothetical protein
MPAEPDAGLRTTVGQYLGFEYSKSRAGEMQGGPHGMTATPCST